MGFIIIHSVFAVAQAICFAINANEKNIGMAVFNVAACAFSIGCIILKLSIT